MLKKLLKHEFRATGRIMLPTLGALMALALISGLFMRILLRSKSGAFSIFKILMGLMQGAFYISLAAVGILVTVMVIYRFYKSLMGDEGYLSFTLPVTVDQHLWCKLLSGLVWTLAAIAGCFISFLLYAKVAGGTVNKLLPDIWSGLRTFAKGMGGGKFALVILEFLVMAVLTILFSNMHFYAAIAVGGCSTKNKKLIGVLGYIVLNIIKNTLSVVLLPILALNGIRGWIGVRIPLADFGSFFSVFNVIMICGCLQALLLGTLFYFTARHCMTKKLNLA